MSEDKLWPVIFFVPARIGFRETSGPAVQIEQSSSLEL